MPTERNNNQVPSLGVKSNADDNADVVLWGDPSTHRLLVNATTTPGGYATVGDGRKTVTAAGTAETLGASTSTSLIIITALEDNTNVVVIGGSTVVAGSNGDGGNSRRGKPLMPNESVELQVSNLNLIYVDSVVSGEGVTFAYFV